MALINGRYDKLTEAVARAIYRSLYRNEYGKQPSKANENEFWNTLTETAGFAIKAYKRTKNDQSQEPQV